MSAEARALAQDMVTLVRSAVRVVADHRKECEEAFRLENAAVRKRVFQSYGPGRGWLHYADPAVLELERALGALGE